MNTIALFLDHVANMTTLEWEQQADEGHQRLRTEKRRPNWDKAQAAGLDEHGVFLAGLTNLEAGGPGQYAGVLRGLQNTAHGAAIEVVGFDAWYDANEAVAALPIRNRKRKWVDAAIAEIQAGEQLYGRGMAEGQRFICLKTFGFNHPGEVELKLAA